jgi:hypothetical protein
MRRFDKKKNMQKANQLAEQRHIESNSLIRESFHDVDGTPIGVDHMHRPIKENLDGVRTKDYNFVVDLEKYFGKPTGHEKQAYLTTDIEDFEINQITSAKNPNWFQASGTIQLMDFHTKRKTPSFI